MLQNVTLDAERYLAVGAALFVLGALGFLTRRNLILMILSAELMLHGVSLTLVTFGQMHNSFEGQAFTIFILTIAACEAGLALSLTLALYQKTKSLDVELWSNLREAEIGVRTEDEQLETHEELPETMDHPLLTPAGVVPSAYDVRPGVSRSNGASQAAARKDMGSHRHE